MPRDQRDSVERNKVENVFGDGCRPYAIPAHEWPIVTGVEGRNSTMPVSIESQNAPERSRAPEK